MMPVDVQHTLPTSVGTMADEVESLLGPAEAEGAFRDSAECSAALLVVPLFFMSPPTPRPKKG